MRNAIYHAVKKLKKCTVKEMAEEVGGVESQDLLPFIKEMRADDLIGMDRGQYYIIEREAIPVKIEREAIPVKIDSTELKRSEKIRSALDILEQKLNKNINPLADIKLKKSVLERLSTLLEDDISAVLKSIVDDLEKYEELSIGIHE